ncbi:sigma factor-like helix-turn-helix DNA-binding protein [Clostridium sp. C105KSO13]|uniref:sigma factor-like helix-turn-helix DNA-binding protein n=1 Tax=Clostridium sp. C105KSO13 TaxID=1776045 RepID=UPI0007406F24|nr:sigma factor-like helix-turn-helix DNA-binding protein [Clostridium sp. C105KSO13]CUX33365.1 RNA polymerase sigma factor [Clostridium sp. C105KSO13]
MRESSSYDEMTVRNQFDRVCKLALEGEAADYCRHMVYRQNHEVMLSELSDSELGKLSTVDEYELDSQWYKVLGYDIEVRDSLIAEALEILTEKRRNVVLLSYFMDMSDAEIARKMKLVRSTVHEHRRRSLEQLKEILEGNVNEKRK